jgi:hypothetical protein
MRVIGARRVQSPSVKNLSAPAMGDHPIVEILSGRILYMTRTSPGARKG